MYTLSGMTFTEGIAAGEALNLTAEGERISSYEKDPLLVNFDPGYEFSRFKKISTEFAERLRRFIAGPVPDTVRDLFGAVSAYLTNPENTAKIREIIFSGDTAANACRSVFLEYLKVFTDSDDTELKSRGRELMALAREFIASLDSDETETLKVPELQRPTVIIAKDLTPARFLCLRTDLVRAVILEGGLSSGHLGTVLRELRIPAIFSVTGATSIPDGEHVLVDANNGNVIIEPPSDTTMAMLNRQHFSDEEISDDVELPIILAPSIGAMRDLEVSPGFLNHGLGLLRSEFLFMGSQTEPDEDEMTRVFTALFNKVPQKALISARTFDFAGDKKPFFRIITDESGPLKGYGANVGSDLLSRELRALLRSAPDRELHIVFPLISRISEANALTALLSDAKESLEKTGIPHASSKIVFMIETPAAVLSAAAFASLSSMCLIGSSSLDEYASAPRLPGDAFTPALAKMIALACKGAKDSNVKVGIAGRYAIRPELLPFFMKLGISYITVDSYSITRLRQVMESNNMTAFNPQFDIDFYNKVMSLGSGQEISALINRLNYNG